METIGTGIAIVIAMAGALFILNKLGEVEEYSNFTDGLGFLDLSFISLLVFGVQLIRVE